jgi:serine/threonine protein kinase
MDNLPDGRLIDDRFELLERIGSGGMGRVWRGRDTSLDRDVALKEVRAVGSDMDETDPQRAMMLRERVLREARALARLQHPNVVTIYHIVDNAELPFPWLVMELVSGGTLEDRLRRGPLSVAETARLGRGVLAGLCAAHDAGVQHRDVKPANILLRADGTPVLTDFGIATLPGATQLTSTGDVLGSPEYIAPERIRGTEGGSASDLWSLALTLYVAVEGRHPFEREGPLSTLMAILDEPLAPPVRSGRLTQALSAVLVREPTARPDGAAFDALLAKADQPGPEPVGEARLRRDRRPVRVLVAAAVTALIGIVAWTVMPARHGSDADNQTPPAVTYLPASGQDTPPPTRAEQASGIHTGASPTDTSGHHQSPPPHRVVAVGTSPTATSPASLAPVQSPTPAAAGLGIRNHASNRCIAVTGGTGAAGNPLVISDCDNSASQTWKFTGDGKVRAMGLCMDAAGGSTANGAVIQLAKCTGAADQQFRLNPAGDLVNPSVHKCVDVKDQQTDNGTGLQLWTCNGQGNQKWSVV